MRRSADLRNGLRRRTFTQVALIAVASLAGSEKVSVCAFSCGNSLHMREPFVVSPSQLSMEPLIAMDESSPPHKAEGEEKEPAQQIDRNGKEFAKGAVVRVVETMRAYQVQSKGFGAFDLQTKTFVPSAPETVVGFLEMPPGLRGVVMRVYDIDEYDASLPIQVKFVPGKHADEGFDPPLAFLMHFHAEEIEIVD